MGRSQAVRQRVQLVAAAGREAEIAAFFRKGFGGGGANALGGAGDQDALAAQMKVHGVLSFACSPVSEANRECSRIAFAHPGYRPTETGQHCTAALRRGLLWFIAIR